jgi:hypothetical protein
MCDEEVFAVRVERSVVEVPRSFVVNRTAWSVRETIRQTTSRKSRSNALKVLYMKFSVSEN